MRNKLRLATWIVCLLAIMVSFACVITAANNIVENNAKVIFISGTGDDANSGLSPKQAVRHLQKATELLNGAGGTIVFSGDVLENTGITIPAQKSKVIFTSIYNGKNYSSTLSFGSAQNQANKNLVFSSEAEINSASKMRPYHQNFCRLYPTVIIMSLKQRMGGICIILHMNHRAGDFQLSFRTPANGCCTYFQHDTGQLCRNMTVKMHI